jgi:hypothetical protein
MSRPTPEQPDTREDEAFLAEIVSEAGNPTVKPRPEHVAELRELVLDRLGLPRPNRRPGMRWLVISGLAAACAAAVLVWPPGDFRDPVPDSSGRPSPDPTAPRTRQDFAGVAAWPNIRRGLDVSEMPAYSWPLPESSRLSVLTRIPSDLLD